MVKISACHVLDTSSILVSSGVIKYQNIDFLRAKLVIKGYYDI